MKTKNNPTNATSSPTTSQNRTLQSTTTNNHSFFPIRHDTNNLQLNPTFEPLPPPQRSQFPNPSTSNTNQTWGISEVQPQPSILTSTQHPKTDPSLVRLTDITDLLKDVSLNKTKRPSVKAPTPKTTIQDKPQVQDITGRLNPVRP